MINHYASDDAANDVFRRPAEGGTGRQRRPSVKGRALVPSPEGAQPSGRSPEGEALWIKAW